MLACALMRSPYAFAGVPILQTMEHVRPATVDWSKVNKECKMVFKKIENLNYAVELAKR